ncbi:uncharacterized protein LOC128993514 [Macrosteles quadrilineatus]|uniref:uncharacterized protein LOC128993514 n=1 Tax=Macrosteles quadrilineatus TaxID=74068 RepID=UPI0023E15C6D|nr:uncharacterized protein LOC128993514 [Macrosteles quadrilineatus]XP_054273446.1 uncharacterized protein LOC128993514 [Macrosteles quadrilineatus]
MAARRARGAAAEPPPPPPPEPIPEPEPEKTEEPAAKVLEPESREGSIIKDGKVTEKIIERIIICPGMQNPCGMMGMMPYPGGYNPMMYQGRPSTGSTDCPVSPCPETHCSKKKSKKKRKGGDKEEPCKHPFCIVQRAKARPQGLPWASGLYPGPPSSNQSSTPQQQPSVVVYQRPVLCCCDKCRPSEDSDSEDDEEVDPQQTDTETFMTFMNLVFAAANVINERPEIL